MSILPILNSSLLNLTLFKSRGKQGIADPSYASAAVAVGELLGDWSERGSELRLAVTLDHRYTQEGLTVDKLKGVDRARAEVLFKPGERLWKNSWLIQKSLSPASVPISNRQARRQLLHGVIDSHRCDCAHDEGKMDFDETASEYDMGEIYDWSLSADHWSDREGNKVLLGEMRLDESEIVANEPLQDAEPNREDFEGYTGNAGMTLERWYHRAAVVIWPRTKHVHVLCSAGTDASIGGFMVMVRRLKRTGAARREALRQNCCTFAAAIIDSWQPAYRSYGWEKRNTDRDAFPASLCELDDAALLERFLSKAMPTDGIVQLDTSLNKFGKKHGWQRLEKPLATVIEASTAATIGRNAEMLRILCTPRDKDSERIGVCSRLCARMAQAVEAFDNESGKPDWRARQVDRAALLRSLVIAMLGVGAEKPLGHLIKHAWSCGKYDLIDAHLAAVFALVKQLGKLATPSAAISKWLSSCRRELENRVAVAPQKPLNYRRAADLSCKCKDCQALAEFLADPERPQARFPMAKARRQHLHGVIDSHRCDCTHVTERRGSPQTLVCTIINPFRSTIGEHSADVVRDRQQRHSILFQFLQRT